VGLLLLLLVGLGAGIVFFREELASLLGIQLAGGNGPSVEYVVDASLRMADTGNPNRFNVARRGLVVNMQDESFREVNAGLRVFGNGQGGSGCDDTALLVGIQRNNAAVIGQALTTLQPGRGEGQVGMTQAILLAIEDLKGQPGPHTLIVITGGPDTCVQNSAQLIQQAIDASGIAIETVLVGYRVPEDNVAELTGLVGTVKDSSFIATQDPMQLARVLDDVRAHTVNPSHPISVPEGVDPFAVHIIDSAPDGATDVLLRDLDNDSDLDVIIAASVSGTIKWYANDGSSDPQFEPHLVDQNVPGAAAVALGDMDRNGTLDLLGLGGNDVLWWAAGSAPLSDLSRDSADTQFSGGSAIEAGDIDGDGLLDIIAAARGAGMISWWRNDGDSPPDFERIQTAIYAPLEGVTDMVLADIDGDGDLDVAAVSPVASVVWAENTGGGGLPSFAPHPISHDIPPSPEHLTAIDIDRDGDTDLLVTDPSSGQLVVYLNEGAGQNWTAYVQRSQLEGLTGIDAHDMNRDGYLDLITALSKDGEGGFTLWESNGGVPPNFLALAMVQNNTQFEHAFGIQGGDIDGDGDADAAATIGGGSLVIWLQRVALEIPDFPEEWCSGLPEAELPAFCKDEPVAATCGNSIIESGEQCDVGAGPAETAQCNGGTCNTTTCQCESGGGFCGDGHLDAAEECDMGEFADVCGTDEEPDTAEASSVCNQLPVQCGEEGATCGPNCQCEGFCGNGVCSSDETVDSCAEDCAVCGDGLCSEGEDRESCADDCGPDCGDGRCEGGETCSSCRTDCGACGPVCGNNRCESGETCSSCRADCGACGPVCGNNRCESSESCESCATDCGECEEACPGADGTLCGDGICQECESEDWCGDCTPEEPEPEVTPDSNPYCGDGSCNGSESCSSCPGDCGSCGPVCGNGSCESGENASNCYSDCGPVCGDGYCDSSKGENCNNCDYNSGGDCICILSAPGPMQISNPTGNLTASKGAPLPLLAASIGMLSLGIIMLKPWDALADLDEDDKQE
jgi:hypothetical protein